MRTSYILITLLFAGIVASGAAQSGWGAHGGDAGATRFSPLTQITPENVSTLRLVWTYDTMPPEGVGSAPPAAGAGRGASSGSAAAVR